MPMWICLRCRSYLIIIIIVIIVSTPEIRMRVLIFMQNYFIVNDTATKLVVLCRLLFSVNLPAFAIFFCNITSSLEVQSCANFQYNFNLWNIIWKSFDWNFYWIVSFCLSKIISLNFLTQKKKIKKISS